MLSHGKKKSDGLATIAPVLALPIFPGRHQPSIFGRDELNYRVRNGNGWTLILISTNSVIRLSTGNIHIIEPLALLVKKNW